MDIEDLSKSQLLLLTILVNFVVSIATGILTVSLLAAAPTTVTQTVNRIVDNTIETIAAPIQTVVTKAPPQGPTTDELLTSAVSAGNARTVLIYKGSTTTPAIAYGVYLPVSKAVATVTTQALPKDAVIEFGTGATARASLSKTGGGITIYGFADNAILPEAPPAGLIGANTLKQGQTVLGTTKDSVATTGIIGKIDENGIYSTISGIPVGASIVDLSGAVIGVAGLTPNIFISADRISALLSATSTKP